MHRLRGELTAARAEFEDALSQAKAGEHRAWLSAAPAYAELLLLQDDAAGAEREARAILESVRTLGLARPCAVAGQRILALALSKQQQHDAARAAIMHAFALARDLEHGGLPLARLYEAHAQVSLSAGNTQECVAMLKELWPLIEHSDARALINAYETLREESTKQIGQPDLPAAARTGGATSMESSTLYTEVQTLLTSVNRSEDRASQALKLLMEDSGAQAGHLLLLDANGLFAAVAINDNQPSEQLVQDAQSYLDMKLADASTVTGSAELQTMAGSLSHGAWVFAPVLLANRGGDRPVLVGMAMLAVNDNQLRAPRSELIRVISQCLLAAGDSVAIALDE
jgi:hypothetical protein